jgi:hypothetical protein
MRRTPADGIGAPRRHARVPAPDFFHSFSKICASLNLRVRFIQFPQLASLG